jgi:hypothetical protein
MARLQKKMQAAGTTGLAETSRPSLRDGFTVCFALSPGTGFSCPRVATTRKRVALGISNGMPGPHDFAVRECAVRR